MTTRLGLANRTGRVLVAIGIATALLVFAFSAGGDAQSGPIVQQSPQQLNAASTLHSHTSAATITIPAGDANKFVYVDGIDIANCAGGTAVTAATPTFITTTNLPGAPQWMLGSGVTAGLCQPSPTGSAIVPIKASAAATAVTVVLPAFATNQTVSVTVYFHYGL